MVVSTIFCLNSDCKVLSSENICHFLRKHLPFSTKTYFIFFPEKGGHEVSPPLSAEVLRRKTRNFLEDLAEVEGVLKAELIRYLVDLQIRLSQKSLSLLYLLHVDILADPYSLVLFEIMAQVVWADPIGVRNVLQIDFLM